MAVYAGYFQQRWACSKGLVWQTIKPKVSRREGFDVQMVWSRGALLFVRLVILALVHLDATKDHSGICGELSSSTHPSRCTICVCRGSCIFEDLILSSMVLFVNWYCSTEQAILRVRQERTDLCLLAEFPDQKRFVPICVYCTYLQLISVFLSLNHTWCWNLWGLLFIVCKRRHRHYALFSPCGTAASNRAIFVRSGVQNDK